VPEDKIPFLYEKFGVNTLTELGTAFSPVAVKQLHKAMVEKDCRDIGEFVESLKSDALELVERGQGDEALRTVDRMKSVMVAFRE
jgi:oligoribonuclease (3'-5' exoribonuclease)